MTKQQIRTMFTYVAPNAEMVPKFQAIREAASALGEAILDNSPQSADQTAAIRKLREVVTTANMAIVFEGQF